MSSPQADNTNIASHLNAMAACVPERAAIIRATSSRGGQPAYHTSTFSAIDRYTNRLASGLVDCGVGPGTRTLVMIRPGLEFVGLVFALFKMGAVPVLIDPGMGLRAMLRCIRDVQPQALIGIPAAQMVRLLNPGAFATVRVAVTAGRQWGWGGPTLQDVEARGREDFQTRHCAAGELAAILFTSGSTGIAKGVLYTHGVFCAQVEALRQHYGFEPGEAKLATFPLFALFCPGLGLTCIIPDMDASRPATADPRKICSALSDHRPASAFGSPALWGNVLKHCRETGTRLPGLRRLLVAGAPVPGALIEGLCELLDDDGDLHTPYGATESLPVCSISGRELRDGCIARTRRGQGICVGRPVADMTVRIIDIHNGPIAEFSAARPLPPGEIGEIVVRGPVVTQGYYGQPTATAAARIPDGTAMWHRMGDVGYLDTAGRLWFCGRTAHRVQAAAGTLFTIPCEAPFNEHPQVRRCALVGVGAAQRQKPVVVVEPRTPMSRAQQRSLARELGALAAEKELTRPIKSFAFHKALPVDPRHNAKINREQLAEWAARRKPLSADASAES